MYIVFYDTYDNSNEEEGKGTTIAWLIWYPLLSKKRGGAHLIWRKECNANFMMK